MTNKLLPNYTWINGLSYEFKIPMTLNGMKDVKIKTTTCGGKEVWARLGGNHQSYLPSRILMKDIITYIPKFGIIGSLANMLFIKKEINEIFKFREKKIEEIFNKKK